MIPFKRLYIIAGFDDPDVERRASALQREFESGSVRFLGRPYPASSEKRAGYLKGLVKSANELIFGTGNATNFCRKLDQPCAVNSQKEKRMGKTCERSKAGDTACARMRPQLIIVVCADQIFDEAFKRLGRGTLILRVPGPNLPEHELIKTRVDEFEPIAKEVLSKVSQRRKTLYAPLVPDFNFQRLGKHGIAEEIQARPVDFASIIERYHAELYRGDFHNPVKRGIRGAYMLDSDTAFQEDHLHQTIQTIGTESRHDGFHLLNAYHVYGVKTDPGFHFDVMNTKGGPIRHELKDVLTGISSNATEVHLNATPCDRIV